MVTEERFKSEYSEDTKERKPVSNTKPSSYGTKGFVDDTTQFTKGDIKFLFRDFKQMFHDELGDLQQEVDLPQCKLTLESATHFHPTSRSLLLQQRIRNVRIRGIPESIAPKDLMQFVQGLVDSLTVSQVTGPQRWIGYTENSGLLQALVDSPWDVVTQFTDIAYKMKILQKARTRSI
ncbi:Hypothetical predicted protein [Pelobates cultripes]|uniref:Uncharacterized protein n=1 Tax=Pelobates cultripes TaxID=61616 RepID=A0AAD1WJT0_PELCU|nr:Hypothetical predicted protein [Pelobates cultripes]